MPDERFRCADGTVTSNIVEFAESWDEACSIMVTPILENIGGLILGYDNNSVQITFKGQTFNLPAEFLNEMNKYAI